MLYSCEQRAVSCLPEIGLNNLLEGSKDDGSVQDKPDGNPNENFI
jgi:hypothetical protein